MPRKIKGAGVRKNEWTTVKEQGLGPAPADASQPGFYAGFLIELFGVGGGPVLLRRPFISARSISNRIFIVTGASGVCLN